MKEHIAEAIHELCNMGREQVVVHVPVDPRIFNTIDSLVSGSTIQRRAKRGPKEKGGGK